MKTFLFTIPSGYAVLTILSAAGCGLIAGIFYAFSSFIMKALARLPSAQGIAAMQSINIAVINPRFMAVFLGTAVCCIALCIYSVMAWQLPRSALLLAGSVLYLFGTILVTMKCNVPRNDVLAAIDPASVAGEKIWSDYLTAWTNWNHVRTAAALVAMVLFILALCVQLGDQVTR